MQSYLKPKPSHIAQVEPEQLRADTAIAAVQLKQDAMTGVLENIMAWLEKLEAQASVGRPTPIGKSEPRAKRPVVCHNYKQEGHYARGCAVGFTLSRSVLSNKVTAAPVSTTKLAWTPLTWPLMW